MNPLRKKLQSLWITFIKWIAMLPYVGRLVDLAREHAVEGSEACSIVCAFGWFLPTLVNPYYLRSSPYMMSIADWVPRWLMLTGMGLLFAYSAVALMVVPKEAADDSFHERIIAATHKVRWYRSRGVGLRCGVFVWFLISYLLSQHGISTGGIIFGVLSVSCMVGQYMVGELGAQTEEDWKSYLTLTEQSDLMAKAASSSSLLPQTKAPV